jgi:hypothetical protein
VARIVPLEIRVMDIPELRAKLAEFEAHIETLIRERDEWEADYFSLLEQVGGTAPG